MIDFTIIGFPKCGTTSLLININKFQGVETLPYEPQIPEFFDTYTYPSTTKKFGFKNPRIIYDLDDWYPLIKNSKIIICVRHPADYLWSFFWYRKEENKSDSTTFSEIIDHHRTWRDVSTKSAYFDKYIENIYSKFPFDRVLILSLELLQTSPRMYYETVCRFLGIVYDDSINFTTENVNHSKHPFPSSLREKLTNRYSQCFYDLQLLESKSQSFLMG